jgi:hypothetical protein
MNDERLHRKYSASGDQAFRGGNPSREIMQGLVSKYSESVSSRQDPQRSILGRRIIEVNAQR